MSAIRILYDAVTSEIDERMLKQGGEEEGDKLPNMNQRKYKLNALAEITKISRQIINNWTKNKGGYLRTFNVEGSAKFILEEDFLEKMKEVGCYNVKVDDEFRKRYEYKVKL